MKKTLQNILFPIFITLLFLSFVACSSSSKQQTSKWSLASIYNPLKNNLHPTYKIYHNTLNTSILFFKLRISELHFMPGIRSNQEECSFNVRYLLQEIGVDSNFIVDSNTYVYEFRKSDVNKYYISQIPIKAIEGKSYRLKVTLRDNNRKAFSINYLEVEKQRDISEQYFNITKLDGTPLFKNVVVNNGAFRIHHTSPTSDKLYISYYKNDVPLPKPTITAKSDEYLYHQYDSLFTINFDNKTALSLNYEGMYYVQFDTNSSEGISILKQNTNFPKVEEAEGLLPPLSYITTEAEYRSLLEKKNAKLAADRFWEKAGGNIHKGRELIRLYYNRVYFSNYYFTNSRPGWKTDRGMIYIVYGPPHNIKKTALSEIWTYKRKNDENPISFTFKYTPNKYGINNFTLQRSGNHEWHWSEAVYAWISGDIFLYD